MNKKKLFIHIGSPKTGTKALQRFCSLNRPVLKKYNVCYPLIEKSPTAQHHLSWCFSIGKESWPRKWPEDLGGPKQEWGEVVKQLTANTNVISSETFFDTKPEKLSIIKEMLDDYEVKIVVYWRRMDSFINSWCAQPVKSSNETDKFSQSRLDRLPTKEKLDQWAVVFGKENIILRPFERCQLYKKDVVSDFFHHIVGVEISDEFVRKNHDENVHLHQIVLEYKRLVNHFFEAGPELQRVRRALQGVSAELTRHGRKDYYLFSPKQRLKFAMNAEQENQAIAVEYLGRKDGKLFVGPMPDPDESWQGYDRLLAADAKFINRYLAEKHPYVQNMIKEKVRLGRNSDRIQVKEAARLVSPGLSRLTVRNKVKVAKTRISDKMPAKFKTILKRCTHRGVDS